MTIPGIVSTDTALAVLRENIGGFPVSKVKPFGKCFDVPFAFDTEVSSFYDKDGNKVGLLYAWMFGFCGVVCMGRSIWEFQDFIWKLEVLLKEVFPRGSINIVLWVHNLGYDFAFIRKLFHFEKVFCLKSRRPAYAKTGHIIFRDSLIMSGGRSLALIGKELERHDVKKMVGDLDYRTLRTPDTPLTEKEMGYCENDIRVLLAYIYEKTENDGALGNIPLTNTGYVRRDLRKSCIAGGKEYKHRLDEMTLTADCFIALRAAQAGGFTHASRNRVGQVLESVGSFDIRSSYPTVMCLEQFPMSYGVLVSNKYASKNLDTLLKQYCCLFKIKWWNVIPKLGYEFTLSVSKCNPETLDRVRVTNGRIMTAGYLETFVTEIDYEILHDFYAPEHEEIEDFYIFEKGRLPKEIVSPIIDYFWKKTALKGIKGQEREYMISKNMLNSVYGCTCMNPLRDEYGYDDINDFTRNGLPINGDERKELDIEEGIEKYSNDKQRFLFFPWGVWVTAHARRNVTRMIRDVGPDYVYCDTDSVKMVNWSHHFMKFVKYNREVRQKIKAASEYYNIPEERFRPKAKNGSIQTIGTFEFEGVYAKFKTLGAKRYLTMFPRGNTFQYSLTMAGMNKLMGMEWLCGAQRILDEDGNWTGKYRTKDDGESDILGPDVETRNPFDAFTDGMTVPEEHCGRLVLTYIDEERTGTVKDYLGKEYHYKVPTGIHAENAQYHAGMDEDLRNIIAMIIGDVTEEDTN